MDTKKRPTYRLPTVGMRNIKTATAAALCALVYYFFERSPAFACIGAIFGMGSDLANSKLHGGNRLFGTVIGGLLGIALFRVYLIFQPEGGHSLLLVPLVFVGTVLLIVLCQIFWVGGVQPGGVVLCIILFNTPVDTYVSYALNRIFDTAVGVIAALVVNEQGHRLRDMVSTDLLKNTDDPEAFRQAGMYLGIALGNICNLLTLDEILICGDMVACYPRFSPALNEYYEKAVLSTQKAVITPVLVTDAAYGAAKMAVDKFPYTEGVIK